MEFGNDGTVMACFGAVWGRNDEEEEWDVVARNGTVAKENKVGGEKQRGWGVRAQQAAQACHQRPCPSYFLFPPKQHHHTRAYLPLNFVRGTLFVVAELSSRLPLEHGRGFPPTGRTPATKMRSCVSAALANFTARMPFKLLQCA